jgi:outer membrane scaffolding protein for murein synthesis (MipA/OmpV family)
MLRSFACFSLFVVCCGIAVPARAQAQDRPNKEWDVTLGMGAAIRPTYEGSDQYIVSPAPLAHVIWRDAVSLGMDGLSAYWRQENLRVGGGLVFGGGRTQSSGAFRQGDGRLWGMGDVPAALGLRGFADYRLGPVELNASLTKFTANGNDGVLVNFGIGLPYKLTETTMVRASVSANWADQDYMQTFFGVTPTQSFNSGYAQYNARAGIKDVTFGLGVTQQLSQHWALRVDGRLARLTGDAENSPIVFSKTQAVVMSAISYRF